MTDKTKRKLVICESPNKIKTLKSIFKDLGFVNTVVMASVGHISEIRDSGVYNMGIDPKNDFKADYVISADKKDIVSDLKEQVKLADKIYICSDPDREGEAIAWSLKEFLKIPSSKYSRVTFHEITKTAILKAFNSPSKIDDNLVYAAQTRQKLDKIVGYRLSPIARKKIFAKSVGRCQSAGLKLLVDREKEILDFKPETFFELYLNFEKDKSLFKAKYIGTETKTIKKLTSKKECDKIKKECSGSDFIISSIETKERQSNPKPPFTTSTFQQEVSNKLGIGVKQAMSYAQKLFEGIDVNGKHISLITYIRTDSAELSKEFLPVLEEYVKDNYGKKYYHTVRKVKKSENAQEGHEAIRPVDLSMTPEKLSQYISDTNLIKTYDIICKRTIACAMESSITSETTYTVTNGKHRFEFKSNELLFDGYKKVYGKFEDKEDSTNTTTFKEKEILKKPSLIDVEKQTTPPSRYKEATFIKELESRGIGRPSTFATIVETILSASRGYCKVEEKALVPTPLGIKLIDFLDDSFSDIINSHYTAELEKSLDLIAKGKIDSLSFLSSFYSTLDNQIIKIAPPIAQSIDQQCPECGKPLVIRKGKYGEFIGCTGFPNCKYTSKITK